MKTYYLGNGDHKVLGSITSVEQSEFYCECCDEPMNRIFWIKISDLFPGFDKLNVITLLQCRNVDDGGNPNVIINQSDKLPSNNNFISYSIGAEQTAMEQGLLLSFKSKVNGKLTLREDVHYIPKCNVCGQRMDFLLQLNEELGDYNFGTFNAVCFVCQNHDQNTFETVLL